MFNLYTFCLDIRDKAIASEQEMSLSELVSERFAELRNTELLSVRRGCEALMEKINKEMCSRSES
jgi:hypothetical protein